MMYEITVLGTVLLVLIAGMFYIRLMFKREINPVLATWILLAVMLSSSLWMYMGSENSSLTANIAVTASVFNVTIILAGVIAANIYHSTLKVAFDKVQKWCLLGGGCIVIFWLITDQPLYSYILMQILALVAYFATAYRLWNAENTTEPYFFWIASLLSNLCATYPAWVKDDLFAWIFLVRAIPTSLLLLFLIWRIKRRIKAVKLAYAQ